jgi:phage terminase small subunit
VTARTPTALKVLNGSAAHDPQRLNPNEPKVAPLTVLPEPPFPVTNPWAKEAWERIGQQAISLGVLTAADLDTLALAVSALGEYLDATDGWRERDAAWKRYLLALGKFGMNPSDRSRVAAAPVAKADPMAALLEPKRRRTG